MMTDQRADPKLADLWERRDNAKLKLDLHLDRAAQLREINLPDSHPAILDCEQNARAMGRQVAIIDAELGRGW